MRLSCTRFLLVTVAPALLGPLNGCADEPIDPRWANEDIITVGERDRRDNSGLYRAGNELNAWTQQENAKLAQERANAAARNNNAYYGDSKNHAECGTYMNENAGVGGASASEKESWHKAAVENNVRERALGHPECTYHHTGPSRNISK